MLRLRVALPALLLPALSADPAGSQVAVPPGYTVGIVAEGPDITYVTSLAFGPDGTLFAGEGDVISATGRVLRLEDKDGDGRAEVIEPWATGLGVVTGIAFRGHGFGPHEPGDKRGARRTDLERIRRGQFRGQRLDLFVSHFVPGVGGTISRLRDQDGDGTAEVREDIVTGLPSDGENGNQQIAIGPDGRLYFGQGGRTNSGSPPGADGPLNGTILRVDPDGSNLTVYARGLRNAFDLAFTDRGELFATENGPDAGGPVPVTGAPDELNAIVACGDYGWPGRYGMPFESTGTLGPLALFAPGSSSDGLAVVPEGTLPGLQGDLVIAQFGSFTDPSIGRKLVVARQAGERNVAVEDFASGFGRPLDVVFSPEGDLLVADFSNAFFQPRTARIYRIRAEAAAAAGPVTPCP